MGPSDAQVQSMAQEQSEVDDLKEQLDDARKQISRLQLCGNGGRND